MAKHRGPNRLRLTQRAVVVYRRPMNSTEDLDWLRQRLISIDEEIQATAPDDLQTRFDLARAADSCRAMLRSGNAEALAAARISWTERAATKGTHEQNLEALEAMARFMPSEGGGP